MMTVRILCPSGIAEGTVLGIDRGLATVRSARTGAIYVVTLDQLAVVR